LSYLDTGRAQRNLSDLAVCFFVSKLYKLKNIIDFGGGDGLLCRFLRDYGLNCFVKDNMQPLPMLKVLRNRTFKIPIW
jgi:hypothetical protein